MERITILISLVVWIFAFCQESTSQIIPPPTPLKYRNPGIQWYFRYRCRNAGCSFDEVCELWTLPCFQPPCADVPRCVRATGGVDKGGRCPIPSNINQQWISCNTDLGCPGNELCCHGYSGSECRPFFPA